MGEVTTAVSSGAAVANSDTRASAVAHRSCRARSSRWGTDVFTGVEENNSVNSVPMNVSIGDGKDRQSGANPHAAILCGRSAMNLSLPGAEAAPANESVNARPASDGVGARSAEESAGDGRARTFGQRRSTREVRRRARIGESTLRASEGGTEQAGIDAVGTGCAAAAALGVEPTAVYRALRLAAELMHHAVIPARHAARAKPQVRAPRAASPDAAGPCAPSSAGRRGRERCAGCRVRPVWRRCPRTGRPGAWRCGRPPRGRSDGSSTRASTASRPPTRTDRAIEDRRHSPGSG